MAKDKHQVSVKLSPELRQHLNAYKASRGKRSLKAAIVEILEAHFRSIPLPNQLPAVDSSIGRIASLEAKVTYLNEQVAALKQAIATPQLSTPTLRSAISVGQFPPNSAQPQSAANHIQPEVLTVADDDDDDMYDDPDEILYSFLEPQT
ncbi:MAG: hypothetical protein KME12_10700 [Trichocoleus desertorum ATA4-8-CV12]|jgi:hypothetical protein|nr:hypothetical protein [Trichocoleus desertorum ATA4-8-CV12]